MSGAPNRSPDDHEYDNGNSWDDKITPETRHIHEHQLLEQEPADDRAHETHRKIAHQAAPTTHNAGGEPSGEQSDDDPGDDAHIPHPELRCSRETKSIQPAAKSERTCAGLYAGFQHNDDTPATTTFESERP